MNGQNIARPHILMVTHVLPYPPSAGNEIRVLRMLRWFSSKKYRISLVIKPMGIPKVSQESISYLSSLVENLYIFDSCVNLETAGNLRLPSDEAGIDLKLSEIQEMFCPIWFSSEVGRLIDSLRPDVVLAEYSLMGRVLVSSEHTGFLKIIDSIELFSRLKENLARQGITDRVGIDLSQEQEVFLLERADIVLAIQHTEYDVLVSMLPHQRVLITAMDLDFPELSTRDCISDRVLIVGSDNQFNIRGANQFLQEVWPLIKEEVPSATLCVVGKLAGCIESKDPSVKFLGYVDSIADEYLNACVVVNPCLYGTGLKIKTIEALAWGKAHVGWPVSADGISDLGTLPYVVSNDVRSFALAVTSFMKNIELRREYEEKARTFAIAHFSSESVYGPLEALIEMHTSGVQTCQKKNKNPGSEDVDIVKEQKGLYYFTPLFLGGISVNFHVFVLGEEAVLPRIDAGFIKFSATEVITGSIANINRKLQQITVDAEAIVLFIPGGVQFAAQDLLTLAETTVKDPLFGFAIPRVAYTGQVETNLRIISCMPENERRVVEGLPVLLKAAIFRDFGLLDEHAADIDSALAQLFIRANRRGVSARLVNKVLMRATSERKIPLPLQLMRASDHSKALVSQAVLPEIRFERLLNQRFADKKIREVLLDIRNLAPGFNGTAHYILALLEPLSRLAGSKKMNLHFWVLPESADFHCLHKRFPGAVVHQLQPDQCFDASIRLTQPWSLTELRDQSYISTVNVFSVLDTIAWDCHYIRMPHLESVWRTMSEYADGFVYISDFSMRRFNNRFPESLAVTNAVAHCSMDPAEYWVKENSQGLDDAKKEKYEPYVLIVGNRYYHKGLAEVVPLLSVAFPEIHFKVLGESPGSFPNVEEIVSGAQSADSIARLFKNCTCLVFPSFYEGFGLPIFEALAFGKPVLARHSELIDELRSHIVPAEDLFSFVTTSDLVQGLKSLLEQEEKFPANKYSIIQPSNPYRWKDSAEKILDLLDSLLASTNLERCRRRLEFFYRVDMFDVERKGWTEATQNMVSFEVEKEE